MPIYEILIPKRDDWQKMRDKQKVPKGSAKVSIGDSIAAVHKSYSMNTLAQNIKDTDKLLSDLNTYLEMVKKKYPAFTADVTKVIKNSKVHLTNIKAVDLAKKAYPTLYNNANYLFIKTKTEEGAAKKIGVSFSSNSKALRIRLV